MFNRLLVSFDRVIPFAIVFKPAANTKLCYGLELLSVFHRAWPLWNEWLRWFLTGKQELPGFGIVFGFWFVATGSELQRENATNPKSANHGYMPHRANITYHSRLPFQDRYLTGSIPRAFGLAE